MVTEVIIAIVSLFVFYYLLGYLPGRGISPKNNRLHAWGTNDQVWGYIDGDKKRFFKKPLPPGFHPIFRSLIYNKYADEVPEEVKENQKKHTLKNNEGYDAIYDEINTDVYGLKPIRKVTEKVNRLRKKETHPYDLKVVVGSLTFFLRLHCVIKIKNNAMKILDLDQPLEFVGNELQDAVGPWGIEREQALLQAKQYDLNKPDDEKKFKSDIITAMIGLKIDDHKSIVIDGKPLKEYINERIGLYDMEIIEFSLSVGYTSDVKKILDARVKQQQQDEQTILEEKIALTKNVTRLVEKKDELQQIELRKKEFEDVIEPTLEKYGQTMKKINEGYPAGTTLFLGENDPAKQSIGILSKLLQNSKQKGGTDGH